jgi:hypothetical protein
VSASLELLVDHCLAARRIAVDTDEEFIGKLLDAVLFAAGCRLAGAEEQALTVSAARDCEDRNGSLVIKIANGAKRRSEAH